MEVEATWKTQSDEYIPIRQLEDRHLVNIINFLCRNAAKNKAATLRDGYQLDSMLTGEMACMTIERDIFALENMSLDEFLVESVPQWENLVRELWRRGLAGAVNWADVGLCEYPEYTEEERREEMATYFVIEGTEDGGQIRQFSKKELLKAMQDDDYADIDASMAMSQADWDEHDTPCDPNYWGDNIVIIKGTVVQPKPKEEVTVWEVD